MKLSISNKSENGAVKVNVITDRLEQDLWKLYRWHTDRPYYKDFPGFVEYVQSGGSICWDTKF